MTSLETRSTSALFKRAEQLKRWQESDTARESAEPRTRRTTVAKNSGRIQFTDGCVFLAACAAGDKDEVERLVDRGADIDTANVDGLTALHQACIDDNLEMVEFLVQRGADVNRGDNEGWTPLHATASCGFLSIAKYLIDSGANISSVNNDGELAIDISESDEMEELLQKEIETRGIDCDESRNKEERMMLEDAKGWLNSKQFEDTAHPKTGATALHVAAAKGYMGVIRLLLQAGGQVNAQDLDGWTPLHAAAHWGQKEACELLCDQFANMDIKNYVGQTCFDVADPELVRILEDLKKKQATRQKENPEITKLINRPPIPPSVGVAAVGAVLPAAGKRSSMVNNNNNKNSVNNNANNVSNNLNSTLVDNDRSSITRLSLDDKALLSKEVSSQERDLLRTKKTVPETILEKKKKDAKEEEDNQSNSGSEINESSEGSGEESELSESELIHARTKASLEATKRIRAINSDVVVPSRIANANPTLAKTAEGNSSPTLEQKKKTIEINKETDEVHPWRRPHSLRARPSSATPTPTTASSATTATMTTSVGGKLSPKEEEDVQLRRVHSFESDEKFYARLTELRNRIRASSMPVLTGDELKASAAAANSSSDVKQVKPPVRKTSSSDGNGSYFSSLPRSVGHRTLPSLPETGPLVRSISLKDNSPEKAMQDGDDEHSDKARRAVSTSETPLITDLIDEDEDLSRVVKRPNKLEIWKRRDDINSNRPKSDTPTKNPPAQVRSPEDKSPAPSTPEILAQLAAAEKAGITNVFKQFFKSFVPPVRDEESETQRKAHAKRVRETRRSTQGVTLEDLKSAEQLVKKKQQQENQQRTSELQQLVAATATGSDLQLEGKEESAGSRQVGSTATGTTAAKAKAAEEDPAKQERRPSWRLKVDTADKNRFRLEDASGSSSASSSISGPASGPTSGSTSGPASGFTSGPPSGFTSGPSSIASSILSRSSNIASIRAPSNVPTISLPDENDCNSNPSMSPSSSPKPSLQAIQRRKKPQRRSTGVVKAEDMDDIDKESDDGDADDAESLSSDSRGTSVGASVSTRTAAVVASLSTSKSQNGGDVDYKKLWEESQKENVRLRDDLGKLKDDLGTTKRKLEAVTMHTSSSNSGLTDTEKREKKVLEKKLTEMEEELKQLEHLKNDNQRLRDENGALIRVISKLSK